MRYCLPSHDFPRRYITDGLGRRTAIFIGALVMCGATALQTASQTVNMFIGSRFMIGFGCTLAVSLHSRIWLSIDDPYLLHRPTRLPFSSPRSHTQLTVLSSQHFTTPFGTLAPSLLHGPRLVPSKLIILGPGGFLRFCKAFLLSFR